MWLCVERSSKVVNWKRGMASSVLYGLSLGDSLRVHAAAPLETEATEIQLVILASSPCSALHPLTLMPNGCSES